MSLERLVAFKRDYYADMNAFADRLASILELDRARMEDLITTVYFHGVGYVSVCFRSPLMAAALAELGIERQEVDFQRTMRDFIAMCLAAQ